MTDFRSTILTNSRSCRDIVENPDWIAALNDTLNALDAAGSASSSKIFVRSPILRGPTAQKP
jgi:hypothetical protein